MVVVNHVQAELRGLCGRPLRFHAAVVQLQDLALHSGVDGKHAFDEQCLQPDGVFDNAPELRGIIKNDAAAVF